MGVHPKERDFYDEMVKAEELMDRVIQLRIRLEQSPENMSPTDIEYFKLYAAEIAALSAQASAHFAAAQLYFVTKYHQ